jgi:hypothetical protein
MLVIEASPDGQVSHHWRPAKELELPHGGYPSSAHLVDGRIVLAGGRQRDCEEENQQCIDKCMNRPLPRGFGHITSPGRKLGGKYKYCDSECRQAYLDCSRLQELLSQPQKFSAVDAGVDWLKRNHEAILVGSVIILAGVTFVVVLAEAGLIILAPVLLLATAKAEDEAELCEVKAP